MAFGPDMRTRCVCRQLWRIEIRALRGSDFRVLRKWCVDLSHAASGGGHVHLDICSIRVFRREVPREQDCRREGPQSAQMQLGRVGGKVSHAVAFFTNPSSLSQRSVARGFTSSGSSLRQLKMSPAYAVTRPTQFEQSSPRIREMSFFLLHTTIPPRRSLRLF